MDIFDSGKNAYFNDKYLSERKLIENELNTITKQDIVMTCYLRNMRFFSKSSLIDAIACDLFKIKEESSFDARYPYPFSDEYDYSEDITETISDFFLDEIRASRKLGEAIDTRYLYRTEDISNFYRKVRLNELYTIRTKLD